MSEISVKKGDKHVSVSNQGAEISKPESGHTYGLVEEMERALERMDRLFEGYAPRSWLRSLRRDWPAWTDAGFSFEGRVPQVDVIDRDEAILVRAEVPGVAKENLDVSLTETAITIKGSSHHEDSEEKENYYRKEMSRGSFTRTVSLPSEVDGSKAKANFKDGILEVTLPKVETSKRRTIKVE